ncbi:hypothetical protein DAI22_01g360501 [Oryza sativa Japonica Group]|nr:hypothetical protein DAI22_01g360501 [Oryza sativa Japonica Group]
MSGRTLGQDEPGRRRRGRLRGPGRRERAATLVTTTPVAGAPRHLRRFIRLLVIAAVLEEVDRTGWGERGSSLCELSSIGWRLGEVMDGVDRRVRDAGSTGEGGRRRCRVERRRRDGTGVERRWAAGEGGRSQRSRAGRRGGRRLAGGTEAAASSGAPALLLGTGREAAGQRPATPCAAQREGLGLGVTDWRRRRTRKWEGE